MIWQAVLSALMKPVLAVAALVASWFGGRKAGKTAVKLDNLKGEVRAHEIRDEVEDRIASDGDAHERLRDRWGR